jgi:ADP-ribose pyrophosphatase YjhB (NUDIX family)
MVGIVDPSCLEDKSAIAVIPAEGETTPRHALKENLAADESLRDTAMSARCLSALSFDTPEAPSVNMKVSVPPPRSEPIPVSSASSTCTRESDGGAFSDAEGVIHSNAHTAFPSPPARLHRDVSESLNAKVSTRKTSRQGRSTQRWITEKSECIRLVTGVVPILRDGKILFVSSRRKAEWILPKGGWENDETMEESAVRECFEEAGVLGVLGPQLHVVQYETRKAKKRRLELETMERDLKTEPDPKSLLSSYDSKSSPTSPDGKIEAESVKPEAAAATPVSAPLTDQDIARIRDQAAASKDDKHDDKASVASTSHSQVRMSLFPLYVNKVLDVWPESGRFRKAVDIDEAIAMLDFRPELKAALQEVKDRGLYNLEVVNSIAGKATAS